jgi:hypothetical protein
MNWIGNTILITGGVVISGRRQIKLTGVSFCSRAFGWCKRMQIATLPVGIPWRRFLALSPRYGIISPNTL